jgi:autotransporter translocation and assembly factor TamB
MAAPWQPPRPRRRSWPRRIARGALIGVVVLGLVLASVVAFAHTDRGRELIRKQVESILDGIVDGQVRIGSLHGSVLGDLELRDVVVTDPAGTPIVQARSLTARFDVLPLVRQHVAVHAVAAERLVVTGIPATAGPDDEQGGGLGAWVITIEDAHIEGAIVALPAGDVTTLFQGTVRGDARIADQDIRAAARLDGTRSTRGCRRRPWPAPTAPSPSAAAGSPPAALPTCS